MFNFDIANYVKLDDPVLKKITCKVDSDGPGALETADHLKNAAKPIRKPGEWSVDNFL